MEFLLHFLIGAFLSFVGSAPPGMINLTVVDITLKRGMKMALLAGLGAASIEAIQALVALRFTWFFTDDPTVGLALQWGAIPVFFGLGIYYLLKKSRITEAPSPRKSGSIFLQGVGVSALNLLAYPYWIFYGSWLNLNGWMIRETEYIIVFSLGVASGTFLLLWVFAKMSNWIMKKSTKFSLYADRAIGLIMIGFGIWQMINVLTK